MNWAAEELSGINLGDKRLNNRSVKILDALGGNPINSIPASCPRVMPANITHQAVDWRFLALVSIESARAWPVDVQRMSNDWVCSKSCSGSLSASKWCGGMVCIVSS